MERTARIWTFSITVLVAVLLAVEFVAPVGQLFAPALGVGAVVERIVYRTTQAMREKVQELVVGQNLATHVADLEARVAETSAAAAHLAALEEENATLRSIVRFQSSQPGAILTTKIIGQDPIEPLAALRLGLGSEGGIRPGAAVVSPAGVLVGVIDRVGPSVSTVALLMNRHTQVPIRILGKDKTYGLLESPDGLGLRIDQLPKDIVVLPGDVVVTGLGRAGLPPGIPVGTVATVSSPPEGLWQQATVTPLATTVTLDIVSIIVVPENDGGSSQKP